MTFKPIVPALAALVALLACSAASAEYFVDLGIGTHRIASRINGGPGTIDETDTGLHVGLGARRQINDKSDIGVRLEVDSIDSTAFYTLRAFDYRRHISDRLAYGVFAGAARLDLATPAYGWYLGAGIELKEFTRDWNLNIDVRFGDKVARDNLLPNEPRDRSPDNFHDVTGVTVYMSRRF